MPTRDQTNQLHVSNDIHKPADGCLLSVVMVQCCPSPGVQSHAVVYFLPSSLFSDIFACKNAIPAVCNLQARVWHAICGYCNFTAVVLVALCAIKGEHLVFAFNKHLKV